MTPALLPAHAIFSGMYSPSTVTAPAVPSAGHVRPATVPTATPPCVTCAPLAKQCPAVSITLLPARVASNPEVQAKVRSLIFRPPRRLSRQLVREHDVLLASSP